jgi:hypothetical protein
MRSSRGLRPADLPARSRTVSTDYVTHVRRDAFYKIVQIDMQGGKATGAYEDLLTGLVAPDGDVWGLRSACSLRPTGRC